MKTLLATLVLLAPCLCLSSPGTDNPSSGTHPESFIPSNTQLDRTRSASASSFPTASSRGGHWDPLAVTGRHTYGSIPGRGLGWLAGSPSANPGFGSVSSAVSSTFNPGNINQNYNFPRFGSGGLSSNPLLANALGVNNLPPNGFGFGGVSPATLSQLGNYNPTGAWFMPHTKPWTDCDSAINPNCKKRKNLFANPLAYMAAQNAAQYTSPAGWWQFHPAMSVRGSKDPLPTRVKAPRHLLSHYWGLMHPSNGELNHAGSINPNQAFYMSGNAPGGSWNFNNYGNINNNGMRMAGMEGPFNWAHTGATHGWFRPGAAQNGLTAAPLAADAGAFGPFAFEQHHQLGSSFLPPHQIAEGPHHTNGVAPDSPFQSAPLFETLRAAAGSSFIPIPNSFADNINNINGTPNQGNLNLGGYGGKSANPGGNSNHPTAFGTVFDKRNNGVETVNSYEKPSDKVAIGPALDAQKPAPDGPN